MFSTADRPGGTAERKRCSLIRREVHCAPLHPISAFVALCSPRPHFGRVLQVGGRQGCRPTTPTKLRPIGTRRCSIRNRPGSRPIPTDDAKKPAPARWPGADAARVVDKIDRLERTLDAGATPASPNGRQMQTAAEHGMRSVCATVGSIATTAGWILTLRPLLRTRRGRGPRGAAPDRAPERRGAKTGWARRRSASPIDGRAPDVTPRQRGNSEDPMRIRRPRVRIGGLRGSPIRPAIGRGRMSPAVNTLATESRNSPFRRSSLWRCRAHPFSTRRPRAPRDRRDESHRKENESVQAWSTPSQAPRSPCRPSNRASPS